MLSKAYRYFLIEGDELLEKARARVDEIMRAALAWSEFAEERGCDQYFEGWGTLAAIGSTKSTDPPEGWRRRKSLGGFIPNRSTTKGKAEQQAKEALPRMPFNHIAIPDHTKLNNWIGWKPDYREENGGGCLGNAMHAWRGDQHVLTIPAEKHGATFPVPEGCREITKAEWNLIIAQAEVDAERARATERAA